MKANDEKQRGVALFLLAKTTGTRRIYRRISAAYGEHYIHWSVQHCKCWTIAACNSAVGQCANVQCAFVWQNTNDLDTWKKTFLDVDFIRRSRMCKIEWDYGTPSTKLILIVSSPSNINVLAVLAIAFEQNFPHSLFSVRFLFDHSYILIITLIYYF